MQLINSTLPCSHVWAKAVIIFSIIKKKSRCWWIAQRNYTWLQSSSKAQLVDAITPMHREMLQSTQCCLKRFKSVIMCTSQRHLQPQLRVENESGRRGGFRIFSRRSPSFFTTLSQRGFLRRQLRRRRVFLHQQLSQGHTKAHCDPTLNVRQWWRGGTPWRQTLSSAVCGALRDPSEDLVKWNQNRHWSLLFNRVQKRCGAALGRTMCAALRVLVCGSCNYQFNLIHLYCTYFMSEIKLGAHSLVFLEK